MANYLDREGFTHFWNKAKEYIGKRLGSGAVGAAPSNTLNSRLNAIENDLSDIEDLIESEKVKCLLVNEEWYLDENLQDMLYYGQTGEDPELYFQYEGPIEIDGETYYEWVQINDCDLYAYHINEKARICIYTESSDLSHASPYNPIQPIGYGNFNDALGETYKACRYVIVGQKMYNKRFVPEKLSKTTYNFNANGHPYVDLGLPSSTLWAKCDVGCDDDYTIGDTFCWGSTIAYGYRPSWDEYTYGIYYINKEKVTKYCTHLSDGYNGQSNFVDNISELELCDDAAHEWMGGDWHTPSPKHFMELKMYTTVTEINNNGTPGLKFTSKINGNYIFMPYSEYRNGGGWRLMTYWTSSLCTDNNNRAIDVMIYGGDSGLANHEFGFTTAGRNALVQVRGILY